MVPIKIYLGGRRSLGNVCFRTSAGYFDLGASEVDKGGADLHTVWWYRYVFSKSQPSSTCAV